MAKTTQPEAPAEAPAEAQATDPSIADLQKKIELKILQEIEKQVYVAEAAAAVQTYSTFVNAVSASVAISQARG